MARRIPEPLRAMFGQRFFLTTFLFGLAALSMALFDLHNPWLKVLVVAGGLALGLIFDLARYSIRLEIASEHQRDVLARAEQERDDAKLERDQTLEDLQRLLEIEADNVRLTIERDQLLQRANAPRVMLEDVLQTVDGQLEVIGVVQKHRAISAAGGDWQWAITSIRLHDDANVAVTVHADDPTPYANELLALVDPAGLLLATAQALPSGNQQLTLILPAATLPQWMQDALFVDGAASPAGCTVRLVGTVLVPYDRLNDDQLALLNSKLRDAASIVSSAVVGAPVQPELPVQSEQTEETGEDH